MTLRLVLLCAGASTAMRDARFADDDDELDEGGRAKLGALRIPGPPAERCFISPARTARESAGLLGIAAVEAAALRDRDAGDWTGRPLSALPPDALGLWLADPVQAMPGGESMAAVQARVGAWIDGLGEGRVLAITHAAVVRAAIAHTLGLPLAATMDIDVAPLSMTVLSHHGRWRLQELRRA
ncbi:histidine phosphatase family protein [Stakelama pacifica]|uniref:Broad specificity phosphatase PhoE n=1 Tax=Stakelama pacifica TaxID=517720 RepID=A0A4R6FCV8_9SPHN|nr:histidine phosphatase family protein [Stakelama pacifica]TDN78085.1 broad specificity phosphatase PhoE [Stakelama pacifica]GGP00393.1 phosphoglycerate mutase [Stakelama pacifica]